MRNDVIYALRLIRRTPVLSGVAIGALGLGIGVTTALFSVVQAVLLRPLPYAEPDRVVVIAAHDERRPARDRGAFYDVLSGGDAMAVAELTDVFSGVSIVELWTISWSPQFALSGPTDAERVHGAVVDTAFFDVLGVPAAVGRTFQDGVADDNGLVISDGLWRRQFNADPGAIGQTLMLNGEPHVVLGVLPRAVRFTYPLDTDVFTLRPPGPIDPGNMAFQVVARLAPGVSAESATASLTRIPSRAGMLVARPLHDRLTDTKAAGIWMVTSAAAVLCITACANAALLLLTRTMRRMRDIGVRMALGAGRARLFRQAVVESLAVGTLGTALGVGAAWALHPLIIWLAPPEIPRIDEMTLNAGVMAFATLAGLLCALAAGLASYRVMTSSDGAVTVGQLGLTATTGRRVTGWRRTLLAGQTAMLVVLLSAASLLLHSFWNVWTIDLGFVPEQVTAFQLTGARIDPDADRLEPYRRLARTVAELRDTLAGAPGIAAAAIGSGVPLVSAPGFASVPQSRTVDVSHQPRVSVLIRWIDETYLGLMGMRVLEGRAFARDDMVEEPRVVLVSADLARQLFPGDSAVGRTFHWGAAYEIVGVVGDVRWERPEELGQPAFYLPMSHTAGGPYQLVVRSSLPPATVTTMVRDTLRRIDPLQPIDKVTTMDAVVADATVERRFHALATGGFGVLALLLGAIGIFGGVAASVAERLREIGIRLALGATPTRVRWFAMRHSLLPVGIGLVCGGLGALWTTRLLQSFLHELSATDSRTLGAIAAVIIGVALAASWFPARRAVRTDPAAVLRQE